MALIITHSGTEPEKGETPGEPARIGNVEKLALIGVQNSRLFTGSIFVQQLLLCTQ